MLTNTDLVSGLWPDVETFLPTDALQEISQLAVSADRQGAFSEGGLRVLRQVKWPGLVVPRKFGGHGATLLECCAVQRKLGGADPALAIAATMHLGSVGVWVEHYRRQLDMTWVFMEAVATQGLIVASAVAEPTLGGSVNRSTLRAKRADGGWEVTGSKSPLSFACYADLISLQMQTEGSADTPSEVLVALIPRTIPGISSKLSWDTMGMRGSGSDTLVLNQCVIPDPLIVYRGAPGVAEDDDIVSGIICFCLVLTATYLGLAEAALGVTRKLLSHMRIDHLGAVRSELPSFQFGVGQQIAALLTLESASAALAMRMDAHANPQLLIAPALALKQHAIRLIPEILSGFAEACGGASYSRSSALERFWRDSHAIRFHPPTPAPVAQYLGRRALGVAAALDLDECAPGLQATKKKDQH
jgi:alkylation response protein AidB-like acyl-CoA dehydrogenase